MYPVCHLLAPQPRVSGSATTRGSRAARDKEEMEAGQHGECFVSAKLPSPRGVAGGGAQTLSHTSSLGSPQPASESEYTGTMETGGRKEGEGPARQRPCRLHPRPLPSSRCSFTPSSPQGAQHSLTLGERGMTPVLEGPHNTSTQGCDPTFHQMPQQVSHAMPPQVVGLTTCEAPGQVTGTPSS